MPASEIFPNNAQPTPRNPTAVGLSPPTVSPERIYPAIHTVRPHWFTYTVSSRTQKKNWIAGAIGKPGALHREMGVPAGKKIPPNRLAAAAGKGGTLGRRARLAETLKAMNR